jgi:hypothetical protein
MSARVAITGLETVPSVGSQPFPLVCSSSGNHIRAVRWVHYDCRQPAAKPFFLCLLALPLPFTYIYYIGRKEASVSLGSRCFATPLPSMYSKEYGNCRTPCILPRPICSCSNRGIEKRLKAYLAGIRMKLLNFLSLSLRDIPAGANTWTSTTLVLTSSPSGL